MSINKNQVKERNYAKWPSNFANSKIKVTENEDLRDKKKVNIGKKNL